MKDNRIITGFKPDNIIIDNKCPHCNKLSFGIDEYGSDSIFKPSKLIKTMYNCVHCGCMWEVKN